MPTTGPDAIGNNLLLGRGKAYFDRFDAAGAKSGYRFLGNIEKISVTPSVNKVEKFSSTKAAAVKLASVVINQTNLVDMTMSEFIPENLALALFGSTSTITQTSSAITAEALTVGTGGARLGMVYKTLNRNISIVSVKKGATTFVAGTDYDIINAAAGLIYLRPTGGTIVALDALTIDYTKGVFSGVQVSGGAVGKIQGALLFIGDPANGPTYELEIWRVNINPSGALDFLSDAFGTVPLQAEILDDSANHSAFPLYTLSQLA
jgi:hypothetical protein